MLLRNNFQNNYKTVKTAASLAVSNSFELIIMLHDRLEEEINSLIHFIQVKDFHNKAISGQKCIDILIALQSSLDLDSKEDLILNVYSLYDYCLNTIYQSSVSMEHGELKEMISILNDLKEGWSAINEQVQ